MIDGMVKRKIEMKPKPETTVMTRHEILDYLERGILPTHIDPEVVITDWSLYHVTFRKNVQSYHIVGWRGDHARVCSPIQKMNVPGRSFTTRSGREYILVGGPYSVTVECDTGHSKGRGMASAFSFWCKSNGALCVEQKDDILTHAMHKGSAEEYLRFKPDGSVVASAS